MVTILTVASIFRIKVDSFLSLKIGKPRFQSAQLIKNERSAKIISSIITLLLAQKNRRRSNCLPLWESHNLDQHLFS